jgi:ribosomal protein S18 acetylase RimI-like enzyme
MGPWNHVGLSEDEITIREGGADDVDAVLALWARARSRHARTPDRPEDVRRLIELHPGTLFVAVADGAVVGAMLAAWDGWRGNIYRLAVAPDHRRRGIAIRLVRRGEESLRRRGARRVSALVAKEDEVAAGLWDAAGYPPDRWVGRRVRDL